jgi:hypothetical protein
MIVPFGIPSSFTNTPNSVLFFPNHVCIDLHLWTVRGPLQGHLYPPVLRHHRPRPRGVACYLVRPPRGGLLHRSQHHMAWQSHQPVLSDPCVPAVTVHLSCCVFRIITFTGIGLLRHFRRRSL